MSELKVVHIKDVKGERRDPPRMSWILVSEKTVGAQNLSMGVNETYAGGMVPEHKHDNEEEVMYFVAGRGTFVTGGERSLLSRESSFTTRPEIFTRSLIPVMRS